MMVFYIAEEDMKLEDLVMFWDISKVELKILNLLIQYIMKIFLK